MRRVTYAAARRRLSRYRAVVAPRRRLRKLLGRPEMSVLGASSGSGSPAEFKTWLTRIGGRNVAGHPEAWSVREDLPLEAPARVVAVVHVYFTDLLPQIVAHLAHIPVAFDLLLTNASGEHVSVDPERLPHVRNIRVFEVDNHGRDILPLVYLVNAGLLDPYELVVKVHTKKSAWRQDHELDGSGDGWRESLLAALLGSEERVREILNTFAARPDLGMLTGVGSVLGPEYWGDNQETAQALMRRIELPLAEDDLVFVAGSAYWARGFVLQGLRSLTLSAADFEPEAGQVNATTAHAVERVVGLLTRESGGTVEELSRAVSLAPDVDEQAWHRFERSAPRVPRCRVVPFYLPQFHPVPENDRWWGTGFTEWTNVAAARPVYDGHHQPKVPRDLGFYDLRLEEARVQQAELARGHAVSGFMYYYYWFAGRRLLQKPIEALLENDLDFPYCIMWANENWTRRWDGRSEDVLIGQDYEEVPAEAFIEDIMEFLVDPRYLTINGKRLLSVYRPGQMINFGEVVSSWRVAAARRGIELHIVSVDVAEGFDALDDHADVGLDGLMGFPPHNCLWSWVSHEGLGVDPRFTGNLLSYSALVAAAEKKLLSGVTDGSFPGVMVTFDNTARRQWNGDVWLGSNPYTFRRWLGSAVRSVAHRPEQERLVFVNAWNEWAEGAVLEPSDRFRMTYLLAVRDVVHG